LIAIVIADGAVPTRAALERHVDAAALADALIVAADGGARRALELGLTPDVIVGDGDSLPVATADELRASGIEFISHPPAKDESDTELAVREALRRGADRVVVVGAFGGGRLEHTLANVLMLAQPDLADVDIALIDDLSTVRVMGDGPPGTLDLHGSAGDFVSLLPLSERVEGVTTDGLAFPLRDEDLWQGPTRGLSNEMTSDSAAVTRRSGRLAVIHTLNDGDSR